MDSQLKLNGFSFEDQWFSLLKAACFGHKTSDIGA